MKEIPVIYITPPEVVSRYDDIENGVTGRIVYNYDKSHLFYKGMDLGKISDLLDLRDKVDKAINCILNSYPVCSRSEADFKEELLSILGGKNE